MTPSEHLHESPWVVTVPLILLAIPSAVIGWFTVQPVLFGGYLRTVPFTCCRPTTCWREVGEEFHGRAPSWRRRSRRLPLYLAAAGVLAAWLFFSRSGVGGCGASAASSGCTASSINKYGFDWFNEHVIVAAARAGSARRSGRAAMSC